MGRPGMTREFFSTLLRTRRIDAGGEVAGSPGFAVVLERPADRRKGEPVPGNLLPAKEPDLEALLSGLNSFVEQAGAIDQLHLADARNVVDCEQPLDLDPCPRL